MTFQLVFHNFEAICALDKNVPEIWADFVFSGTKIAKTQAIAQRLSIIFLRVAVSDFK